MTVDPVTGATVLAREPRCLETRPCDGRQAAAYWLRLELSEFKDEYGQEFRAGGFWATRKPERLVLAQLEAEEGMLGLVVVDRGAE